MSRTGLQHGAAAKVSVHSFCGAQYRECQVTLVMFLIGPIRVTLAKAGLILLSSLPCVPAV